MRLSSPTTATADGSPSFQGLFAQRTAERWNDTDDMRYLNKLLSKWMPDSSKDVAVDSHPRLSGIMDTINSTLAHGPETRLPSEFYDAKARAIIDRMGVEEWFSGYNESREYRTLGIGALLGDVVERMVSKVEGAGLSIYEIGGENGSLGKGRGGEKGVLFALSGCHDTTLAALLTSMGAFGDEKWPPYTSHVAVELFRKRNGGSTSHTDPSSHAIDSATQKTSSISSRKARILGLYARPFVLTEQCQHSRLFHLASLIHSPARCSILRHRSQTLHRPPVVRAGEAYQATSSVYDSMIN